MAQGNEYDTAMSSKTLLIRFAVLAAISMVAGALVHFAWGLNNAQTISVTVFLVIILATLFFWNFRLAIAFLGLPVLILTQTLELECFREHRAKPAEEIVQLLHESVSRFAENAPQEDDITAVVVVRR